MKIVFMGTPDFAVGALEALIKAGHEIVAVVTQPDKAKGRSDKLTFSPVKECAIKYGLTVLQPEKIKKAEEFPYFCSSGRWSLLQKNNHQNYILDKYLYM